MKKKRWARNFKTDILSYVHTSRSVGYICKFFFMEYSLFILSLSLNSIWVVLQKSTTWIFFKSSILMKDNARHLVTQKSFWEFHHVVNNIVVWAGPRERVESSLAQPGHSRPNLVLLLSYWYDDITLNVEHAPFLHVHFI